MKKPIDLKSVIIGILGTVLVFTLLGAHRKKEAQFDTITAKEIKIINPKGIPVAVLRSTEEGGGTLDIYNKEGKLVAALASTEGGAGLGIFNKEEKFVAGLGGTKGGGGKLDIYNQYNKRVVSIQANKNRDGAIYLYDRDGELGWAMSGKR